MLDCAEEPFDQVTLAVKREVATALDFPVRFRGDDDADRARCQAVNEVIGVIPLVAEQGVWLDKRQQRVGLCDVMDLSTREAER